MSAFEDIGVDNHLAITSAKLATVKAREGDSNDAEFEALNDYIDTLERTLLTLGVAIDDNGVVSKADPRVEFKIGDEVLYQPWPRSTFHERGVVTAVTERYVMVRYGGDVFAKSTPPHLLAKVSE